MRVEQVEIYSDAVNAAVLRHPGRKFPGVLVQGDTLHGFAEALRRIVAEGPRLSEDATDELVALVAHVEDLLAHYKVVLSEHNIELPFHEPPRA